MREPNLLALPQKLLFITDVERTIGRHRLTLRRWWMAGKFPKPVKLNGTSLAWHSDTVDRWIYQNMNISSEQGNVDLGTEHATSSKCTQKCTHGFVVAEN